MRVLAGLEWSGATNVAVAAISADCASLGGVTWGPGQLLRDLELRLGLTQRAEPQALRVARFQARIADVSGEGRYYSRSFEVDPRGTAEALLHLRDTLVEAGWNGEAIEGGGKRLEALHELSRLDSAALPPGRADRLATVLRELEAVPRWLYDEVSLAESLELWPARWQGVFRALASAGTSLTRVQRALPAASRDSDLGRLQAALTSRSGAVTAQGDGSLIHLTAETTWEAACAAAAVTASLPQDRVLVIREGDGAALDGALGAQGLRTQGLSSEGAWHAAAQVLPLALELAFEPKDPSHVLELLTLPNGPFQGRVGHVLARVLGDAPGIGGPRWKEAKAALRGDGSTPDRDRSVARAEEWLETRGAAISEGADKATLLLVAERVRSWLLSRIAATPDDVTLLGAAEQCRAFSAALEEEPRLALSLPEVRKLVGSVLAQSTAVELVPEQAGRLDHIPSATAVWEHRPIVIWWGFENHDHASGPIRAPWRRAELSALRRAGITFPEPFALLQERAAAARRAFACATERIVLVSARSKKGSAVGNHPLWDELAARLDAASLSRLTVDSRDLLRGEGARLLTPALAQRSSVSLPGGRAEWTPTCEVAPLQRFSYGSLDALLGCPLQWLLRYRAGTYPGGHSLPPLFQLNGKLGHRLIEVLHQRGELGLPEAQLRERCLAVLSELYEREGALLLRPGMGFERSQLERQLVGSVVELARALSDAGLRIIAVEHPLDVTHRAYQLEGRVDLVVARADGVRGIIDLKWGIASYRDALKAGRALQLALYAFAHGAEQRAPEPLEAAYFSLKQGKLFGLSSRLLPSAEIVPGPSLAETWARAERSLERAEHTIAARRFPVTGLRRSLPLVAALGVPEAERAAHFEAGAGESCAYCGFDAVCGRRWEEWS